MRIKQLCNRKVEILQWLYGPEKFPELPRNGPQGRTLIKGKFEIRADLTHERLPCRYFTKNQYGFLNYVLHQSVGGIVVSIAAFQAVDPGSIPGRRK